MTVAAPDTTKTAAQTSTHTPVMQHYIDTKQEHPEALLFYRMGDFYELFFDDAIVAAKVLDIALTKRGKADQEPIPMCGVPHHAYEPYLHQLISAGYHVAVCEQMETPQEAKKRGGSKALVRREIVRVVTPGTVVEDALLDAKSPNYLCAVMRDKEIYALAWCDVSTGEFSTSLSSAEALVSDLVRVQPKEILMPEPLMQDPSLGLIHQEYKREIVPQVASVFDASRGREKVLDVFGVASLEGFGDFSKAELAACGALIEYVSLTQRGALPRLNPPKHISVSHMMGIDAATRRNLELSKGLNGQKKGSLLHVIDQTSSAIGARTLHRYLATPLTCPIQINERLEMVEYVHNRPHMDASLTESLQHIPDIERALSRLFLGKGSPRDLIAIREGMQHATRIAEILEFAQDPLPSGLIKECKRMIVSDNLLMRLSESLKDEVGVLLRDGGFIRSGVHPKLDECQSLAQGSRHRMQQLQEEYRKLSGIETLKVKHNKVLGYFVEVTAAQSAKITDSLFMHRQTTANAIRYTTTDLAGLEQDLLTAHDQSIRLELMLFEELVTAVLDEASSIASTAQAIGAIDVICSFAKTAKRHHYVRPVVDDSADFSVRKGRHPVVEHHSAAEFIPNSSAVQGDERVWLITGPNMAGKSTYLRQQAIIAIMAQMGSFVPAEAAHIGVFDQIFSRVGAADDLARGQSTFMVEMIETATILHHATARSLVILDEIGRGTATYDGLSIAWAVLEHLHTHIGSRTLFATHYHELTALTSSLSALACYRMRVRECEGKIVFAHEVEAGAADRSYGVHVASIAGVPRAVTARAEEILAHIEASKSINAKMQVVNDLPLFAFNESLGDLPPAASHAAPSTIDEPSKLEKHLKAQDLDTLTPRQALDVLYEMKEML